MFSLVLRNSDSFSTLFSFNDIDSFLNSLFSLVPFLSSDDLSNVRLFCESSCPGCVYVFPFSDCEYIVAIN